ncbi:hypothetical protein [Desulforegula conservatrix]|uniref:hypothetical protein n=1 Tax=Desulforegula conservatrix TaxID=153026 RepID=UPI00047F7AC1|nr:hypothetical protein [Desulforegula conservatrix]
MTDTKSQKIRKQIYDLTIEDLQTFSIWEFCSDEEGFNEQDECTVRPKSNNHFEYVNKLICLTSYTFNNGNSYLGYITPSLNMQEAQPHIIINSQLTMQFWFGINKPNILVIEKNFNQIDCKLSEVFPISWRIIPIIHGLPFKGVIDDFYYLNDDFQISRLSTKK